MIRKKWYVEILILFCIGAGLVSPGMNSLGASGTPIMLLINEVMLHPSESEATNEWIELFNPTSESIDVESWVIADEKEADILQGDLDHGNGSSSIPPGGYAIVTDKGTTIYDSYEIQDTVVRLSVDDSTLCGYGLNNQQEKLILMDPEGSCVDAVEWGDDYEDVPGAPFGIPAEGNSLTRYQQVDTDDTVSDFYECDDPTPGRENVLAIPVEEPGEGGTEETVSEETVEESSASVLITELYYDTHPNINAEYVRLLNPMNISLDVSGWYVTDKPWKEPDDRPKILFPEQTIMPPNTTWFLTKDASTFFWETAQLPSFEYAVDSLSDVPQLETFRSVSFSSTGGLVGFYSASNSLMDLIIYGETDEYVSGWEGPAIPSSGQGIILKRNHCNETWYDTDSASDWSHHRIYQIGQSDFPLRTISCSGEVSLFVSPDASFAVIADELQKAQYSIDMNMYEFTNPFLYQELCDALKRNVTVRVFMEGSPIGGIDDREIYILKNLASQGAAIRFLVSDEKNQVKARYQFNHAKYLLIDNETVIVESCNWAKTGIPKDPSYGNREWGIVVRNKEVTEIFLQVFQDDWDPLHTDSYPLEEMNFTDYPEFLLDYYVPTGSYQPKFNAQTISGSFRITPVFSPDTSEQALLDAIDAANSSIYIQQLYIYKDWGEIPSPLIEHLVNKSLEGIEVLVLLDYQVSFDKTITLLEETKEYLETSGIKVKFISSDWSPFTTLHNKGMIIDNSTVLISSINWNEQSIRKNREAGLLITNQDVARYYASVFLSDWKLEPSQKHTSALIWADYKYLMLIAVVVCITLVLILRDWRKRKWT